MGSNRKLPFGYQMESGQAVLCSEEAKLVRQLFSRYEQGESLGTLTEWLRKQDIPYQGGKLWNKNMVARILADTRYTGECRYPQIIPKDTFLAVEEKRSKRSAPIRQTEAQKILWQKCSYKPTADTENQVLSILNWLILYPGKIVTSAVPSGVAEKVKVLEHQLEETLSQLPVDQETAKAQVMELAAARYQAIDSSRYETERLRRLFQKLEPMSELDANLLRQAVSTVHINGHGQVTLELKNKQIVQRESEDRG